MYVEYKNFNTGTCMYTLMHVNEYCRKLGGMRADGNEERAMMIVQICFFIRLLSDSPIRLALGVGKEGIYVKRTHTKFAFQSLFFHIFFFTMTFFISSFQLRNKKKMTARQYKMTSQ
jgi:hypothetical protein